MTPDEALRRIHEARETNAEILDLGDLPLDELPDAFHDLPYLRILALGWNRPYLTHGELKWARNDRRSDKPFTKLLALKNLTNLIWLDLSGCHSLQDLDVFCELTSLNWLCLSGCRSLQSVEGLASLSNLTWLDLSGCRSLQSVEGLASLSNLKSLRLNSCRSLQNVEGLANLSNLRALDLSNCRALQNVNPLIGLTNLTWLDLSRCPALENVNSLAGLINLTWLDLGNCSGLQNVDVLKGLTNLTSLNLSNCSSLQNVDVLKGLTDLTHLDLSGCGPLGAFGPIEERLTKLEKLYLYNSTFNDLPDEVCGEKYENLVIGKGVRAYFDDLKHGAQSDAEVKVFLLGNGCTGKTQLVRKLCDEEFQEEWDSTHGVQLRQRELPVGGMETPARLNLWDFGGQDIYHGSHALFLHRQAVYIVLWNPETENDDSYEENGIPMRNHRLAYWLDYICGVAGEEDPQTKEWRVRCPVLIVQSKCDSREVKAKLPDINLDDFSFHDELQHSARTGRGHEGFLETLQEAIEHLHRRRRQPLIGKGRVAVRNQLRAMQQTPEVERERTITRERFHTMCEATGAVSNPNALLQFLHRSGVVFYKPGLFHDRIIVDQGWALDAIYTLLNRAQTMPALLQHGKFTRRDLEVLLWEEKGYSEEEQRTFLSMMESCGICFKARCLSENKYAADAEWEYIAPELLPAWSEVEKELLGWVPDDPAVVSVRLTYRFLHEGILRSFLSRIGQEVGDGPSYWKYGCRFFEEKTRSKVLITSEYQNGPSLQEGAILFQAWGKAPQELIEKLLKIHEGIHVGQRPTIEWPHAPIPERETMQLEADTPLLVFARDTDDPRRKVYISYAWGNVNSTNEVDRRRQETVEKLCEILEPKDGCLVVRDKTWMRKGDLISEFMKAIGRGGCVVTILSEKYLQSEFCITELDHIYNYSLRDAKEFQARIVPIVLPDAKIFTPTDRDKIVDFWKNREAYFAPKAAEGEISTDEYTLFKLIKEWKVRLRDILSAIIETLHIYSFEDMMAHDFQAVRELLERRFRERESNTARVR